MKNIYNTKLVYFAIIFISIILHQTSFAQSQKSVSEILNENGRIKSGVNGSYNARGYTLDYGKNKEPIFKKSNSLQKVSTITWSALGVGADSYVYAIAVSGSDVYVGGSFTTAGGNPANYIALWNGSAWSALGTGVNNNVYAITVNGSNVYVGGGFTTAGDSSVNYIAKWNGSVWSALGTGAYKFNGAQVMAIAATDSNVYVGGGFTSVDGKTANNIAKWNGSAWFSLGSGSANGVSNQVNAISVSGSNVYVGGIFTTAGGISATYIALWNGSAWSTLGTGVNSNVNAIAVNGSNVYVGGYFTTAGGSSANYIAIWNGSAWSTMGTGMNNWVNAIAVSGSDVYAGGAFTTAGGSSASHIAKWNGSAWSALGTGTNGYENALSVNANAGAMMVGGYFTTAGGTTVNYIAQFADGDNPLPVELQSFTAVSKLNKVELNWTTATEVNNYGFEVELLNPPTSTWKKLGFVKGIGNSNTPKNYSFVDNTISNGSYSFRLKQVDNDGTYKYSSVVLVNVGQFPNGFVLKQNYPNPFNPTTTIEYAIPKAEYVTLKVYDELGIEVSTLVNENKEAGEYSVSFNGSGLSSGIYYYRIAAGSFSEVKKLTLLK